MYQDILQEHIDDKTSYGEKPQPPCDAERLARLRERAARELNTELPEGYTKFLGITNGLDSNGLVIYASETGPIEGHDDMSIEGIVEANQGYWENPASRRFLFVGESGTSFYVLDRQDGAYRILDRQSQSMMEDLPSFEALLSRALEENRP
jgi:hypothetical protein